MKRTAAQIARVKVLGEMDLLEMILLEVPMRDVLVNAQRVCRTFKGTVDHSLPLQRHLFLHPDSNHIEAGFDGSKPGRTAFAAKAYKDEDDRGALVLKGGVRCVESGILLRINPLLPVLWPGPTMPLDNEKFQRLLYYQRMSGLNPVTTIFDKGYCKLALGNSCTTGNLQLRTQCCVDGSNVLPGLSPAFVSAKRYQNASCRRMFLTQPPVRAVLCSTWPGLGSYGWHSRVEMTSGVMLEDLWQDRLERDIYEYSFFKSDYFKYMVEISLCDVEVKVIGQESDEEDDYDEESHKDENNEDESHENQSDEREDDMDRDSEEEVERYDDYDKGMEVDEA